MRRANRTSPRSLEQFLHGNRDEFRRVVLISSQSTTYTLGHHDVEVQRLLLQGKLFNDYTKYALRLAGIGSGMRVLDIGSGPGDVSFIAALLVNATGSILGVDADPGIVELARARAADAGLDTVRFQQGVIDAITVDEPFDAVVGRLVLMHLPDPAAALRRLATLVRPGGIVAFSENDITATRSTPEIPAFRQVSEGIVRAFEELGLNPRFGTTLQDAFRRTGLAAPRLSLGAPVGTAEDPDILSYAVEVWRLVYPVVQQLGLVTDGLQLEGLAARFRDEAIAHNAMLFMPPLITA